jgi:glucose/arabinose dehydrogenase
MSDSISRASEKQLVRIFLQKIFCWISWPLVGWLTLISIGAVPIEAQPQKVHTLRYGAGRSISLSLPEGFDIDVVASGLERVRFFGRSPDGRVFVTGMHSIEDNKQGSVFILEGWDARSLKFRRVVHYLDHLRNPNSLVFWTDPRTNQSWLYLALTDRLVRYRYKAGDNAPSAAPEVLLKFPDYGLNYKYGGWHLTRTVAVGQVRGATRIFVSAGSSCNYCEESEVARAAVIGMDPDGKNQSLIAQGLRNAVDMQYVPAVEGGALFATNMGDDHLGDNRPDDTFFQLEVSPQSPINYGWPACYFDNGKVVHDSTPLPSLDAVLKRNPSAGDENYKRGESVYGKQTGVAEAGTNLPARGGHASRTDPNAALGKPAAPLANCGQVPVPYTTFTAHSSPLGFAYFSGGDSLLHDSFLVALHGAGHPRIGTGYRVVRFTPSSRKPRDFIIGFLSGDAGKRVVHGRPCGILRVGLDSFLLTDDYLGLIYYIRPHGAPASF